MPYSGIKRVSTNYPNPTPWEQQPRPQVWGKERGAYSTMAKAQALAWDLEVILAPPLTDHVTLSNLASLSLHLIPVNGWIIIIPVNNGYQ